MAVYRGYSDGKVDITVDDPYHYPYVSALGCANMNEDYRVDVAVIERMQIKESLRCLTVASSGETCLALAAMPKFKVPGRPFPPLPYRPPAFPFSRVGWVGDRHF